jgi:putative ABC transport system ATP-binding protein
MTVVVITHNLALTPMGDQVIRVKSGLIDTIEHNAAPLSIEEIEW